MSRPRKQKNIFTCGHRGFGRWCHREGMKQGDLGNGETVLVANVPDPTRHVKGHGQPRAKVAGMLV